MLLHYPYSCFIRCIRISSSIVGLQRFEHFYVIALYILNIIIITPTNIVNQHHRRLLLRHTTLSVKHIEVRQPLINSRGSRRRVTRDAEETRQANGGGMAWCAPCNALTNVSTSAALACIKRCDISIAPAMPLPLHNTQCHNRLTDCSLPGSYRSYPAAARVAFLLHICIAHPSFR